MYRSYALFFLDRRDTKNISVCKKIRSALISCGFLVKDMSPFCHFFCIWHLKGPIKNFPLRFSMCRFFRKFPGIPGRFYMADFTFRLKHEKKWSLFFFWNGHLYFEMKKENGRKSHQNLPWTQICTR